MNTQAKLDVLIQQSASTKDKLFFAGLSLFSQKGYANVGIRELCRLVGIKESSFYNHYHSKESLLDAILSYFSKASHQVVMNDVEIHAMIEACDVHAFLIENMKRFTAITSNVQYHTALQIVLTESFLHPKAAEVARNNLYYLRKDYTEQILTGFMERGAIIPCNVETVTAEYYYALKGILDEYLLLQTWDYDMQEIENRIRTHIEFYTALLTPSNERNLS